jgi:ribosome-binding factor A
MAQMKRAGRVAQLIKHELAQALTRHIQDPRVGFVTVTEVRLSDDLKHARVYYSVMGKDVEKQETQAGLEKARGYLQRDLANNLKLRFTPRLSFALDESLDEGMKIDSIIGKIHGEEGARSTPS